MDAHDGDLAPIDYLAVEFLDGVMLGSGFDLLLDLVDRGVVRLLDVEFLSIGGDKTARTVGVGDVPTSGDLDLTPFEGASSNLLDASDLSVIAEDATPGSLVVIVVYENLWVFSLVDQWRAAGARLVADGGVAVADLVQSLDAAETADSRGGAA